jgi:D-alanyl-lipoteichoic acid acyltransferase DltB (MBOAT superfamily)
VLFNSPYFIFLFLPTSIIVYFSLNKLYAPLGKIWLVVASLFFYGYWNTDYLFLIIISIIINFSIGQWLHSFDSYYFKKNNQNSKTIIFFHTPNIKKIILILGIIFNIALLAYYKYFDFIIFNINHLFDSDFPTLNLLLPLAISFFTFQQVAYLVDSYKTETQEYSFLNYCLFVTFFAQLIAGPIVHHKEMMPQFSDTNNSSLNINNIAKGLFIFSLGLFKKIVIADNFSIWANQGFNSTQILTFLDAWATSFSYTFQLYYDFSAYTDMAIGAALMFNIILPKNFNSPYKALNIQDFWRRWHMTLSRWLKDYLYITLGGNRKGNSRMYLNLLLTFIIGGLWHGAAWTFIIWGMLHGIAIIIHRLWQKIDYNLPALLSWLITFLFINLTWVFFRAPDLSSAMKIISSMFAFHLISVEQIHTSILTLFFIIIFGGIAFIAKNSLEIVNKKTSYTLIDSIFIALTLFLSIILSISSSASEFLYFNF